MRTPSLLFALTASIALGCGGDPSPFVPDDVTRTDAGLPQYDGSTDRPVVDRPAPDVLDLTDVAPPKDVPASDVMCAPTLSTTVRFGRDGGLVPFVDRNVIAPPASFRIERRSGGSMGTVSAMCETTLPGCNTADMVDVGELNAALAARDVQSALGFARGMPMMEALYGTDPRPMDGTVFVIEVDGARLLVGAPCRVGMMAGCLATPVGVQRLVDVLTALRDQEVLRPACMALRNP
jgi:hypothetical protein